MSRSNTGAAKGALISALALFRRAGGDGIPALLLAAMVSFAGIREATATLITVQGSSGGTFGEVSAYDDPHSGGFRITQSIPDLDSTVFAATPYQNGLSGAAASEKDFFTTGNGTESVTISRGATVLITGPQGTEASTVFQIDFTLSGAVNYAISGRGNAYGNDGADRFTVAVELTELGTRAVVFSDFDQLTLGVSSATPKQFSFGSDDDGFGDLVGGLTGTLAPGSYRYSVLTKVEDIGSDLSSTAHGFLNYALQLTAVQAPPPPPVTAVPEPGTSLLFLAGLLMLGMFRPRLV